MLYGAHLWCVHDTFCIRWVTSWVEVHLQDHGLCFHTCRLEASKSKACRHGRIVLGARRDT